MEIRKGNPRDFDQIWPILKEVISKGESFTFDPDTSKEDMQDYWCGKDKHLYLAIAEEIIVGSFIIKDNQPGLGSHIANAAYIVSEKASGKGIGKAMGVFSLEEARYLGYKAMQFNIVVKSNTRAVRLWLSLGFEIVGEIPGAFNHRQNGLTNAYIMYRKL